MPKWRVETDSGIYEVESDAEPTANDIEKFLSATKSTKNGVNFDTPLESAQKGRHGGAGIDMALEAGLPLTAQALTSPATETGATSVIGAGASILGNVLAQTRRVAMGEQDEFSGGQIAQAAATGAIPFVGPAAKATSRPILRAVMDAGITGTKAAAVGLGGEAIKVAIDEGRLPTASEAATAAIIPGTLGGGASVIGSMAKGIATRGKRVAENVADYGATRATPGMLMPEEFAATEQKLARNSPGGKVSKRVDAAYSDMADQVQNVAPNPREGAEIFESASPLLGQISSADKELAKLNESAQAANQKAREAIQKVRLAKDVVADEGKAAGVKAAQAASDEAFNANLDSSLENAKQLATERVTGGAQGVDPATARTLFVEHVAKPIEAAFEEKSAQMYSLVDNQVATFSTAPIMATAAKVADAVTGNLPKKLEASLAVVRDVLGGDESGMVSLQALRNARAELLRKVRVGEFGSNNEERLIKEIAADITKQIDEQAVTALGEEGGNALRAANKFYRETRPLFDQRGVDVLFTTAPSDDVTRSVIAGMEKAGVNADEYKNLKALIDKIKESHPDLAEQAQTHVNETLRRSVIFDASRVNPASQSGELLVDSNALVDRLDKMARVPGTLEALNLGTPAKVAELKKLVAQYPEAAKMTTTQWNALMESPAFAEASAGNLSSAVAPAMAASQAEAQLVLAANLRAGGNIERAESAYRRAEQTVRDIGGDLKAMQARYEALLKDPVAVALNNPGIGSDGFNSFANTLFNPKANALTNTDVRAVVDALKSSPVPANRDLLTRLQERYIADKIAAYHSTPVSSQMLEHPDANSVALFFNPTNPGDAANEIARARALLSPEQLNALSAFARTAKSVSLYEKLGIVPVKAGSYDIPVVGQVRRGLDAIADLYREGRYTIAAGLLSNPSKFSRIAIKVGDSASDASWSTGNAAQGVGRAVDANTNRR